ncbi:MAG: hypothetical protein PUD16_08635 [bacterium]|nr:hypothetical protein [bacterium]
MQNTLFRKAGTGCFLLVVLTRNWPPHHRFAELPLKGKLEDVRTFPNNIKLFVQSSEACSQLRKLPLEGKLSASPTDEV